MLFPTKIDRQSEHSKLAAEAEDEKLFLQGVHTRRFELLRAVRIFFECIRGFRALHFVGPCVTVFGSARFGEGHPYYRLAQKLGAELAHSGFTVMTGGGPGIMEAANRGAREANGPSIGCNLLFDADRQSGHPSLEVDPLGHFG